MPPTVNFDYVGAVSLDLSLSLAEERITNDEVVRREQLKCNESSSAAAAADSTNGLIL
jgi:hypothetical protein